MNTQDLAPLQQQVDRSLASGWSWCLPRPELIKELMDDYRDAMEKITRLALIHELARQGQLALADHHICECHDPNVKDILGEILELSDVS